MGLHTYSHHMENHLPDWRAAALGGIAGGTVYLIIQMITAAVSGVSIWLPLRLIAAIVLGQEILLSPPTFDLGIVVLALLLHFSLATLMGLIFGLLVASNLFDASWVTASVSGVLFSSVIYFFNFYGLTEFFPWFLAERDWPTFLAHALFGMVMADVYLKLERKGRPPRPPNQAS